MDGAAGANGSREGAEDGMYDGRSVTPLSLGDPGAMVGMSGNDDSMVGLIRLVGMRESGMA